MRQVDIGKTMVALAPTFRRAFNVAGNADGQHFAESSRKQRHKAGFLTLHLLQSAATTLAR
jgi:hypothetical protein